MTLTIDTIAGYLRFGFIWDLLERSVFVTPQINGRFDEKVSSGAKNENFIINSLLLPCGSR